MTPLSQSTVRNRLLQLMQPNDFALLAPHLVADKKSRGTVMFEPDEPVDRVWFLESGIASMVAVSPEKLRAEASLIGREGFFPVSAALGSDHSPYQGVIQLPDDCHWIDLTAFRGAIEQDRVPPSGVASAA